MPGWAAPVGLFHLFSPFTQGDARASLALGWLVAGPLALKRGHWDLHANIRKPFAFRPLQRSILPSVDVGPMPKILSANAG